MNCQQAQLSLAIYRELQEAPPGSPEARELALLDAHLETCRACQRSQQSLASVGVSLRALKPLTLDSSATTRLMQALAAEHVRALQSSPSLPPPPSFLTPYIQEHVRQPEHNDTLVALAHANTGPLSPVASVKTVRRSPRMKQFAIMGMAAAILLVLMTGGLTSLLLLSKNAPVDPPTTSVSRPSQISLSHYTADTPYSRVISAISNRDTIYYSASTKAGNAWMISALNRQTNTVSSLLPQESENPLIVLSADQNWLIWLEVEDVTTINQIEHVPTVVERKWKLQALYLGALADANSALQIPLAYTITSDTLKLNAVPDWAQNPIQGVWFTNSGLLVAHIDQKGISHLQEFALEAQEVGAKVEIATAPTGHILTSPTGKRDGSTIYWGEEWQDQNGFLRSNIWTQRTDLEALKPTQKAVELATEKLLYRNDGTSFRPQMVGDVLFFIKIADPVSTTPVASATVTVTPTLKVTLPTTPITPRIEASMYTTPLNEQIQGTLYMLSSVDKDPVPLDNDAQVSATQGGSRFLLWQSQSKGFQMYDVAASLSVTVSNALPKGASFLAVNGETATWMNKSALNNTSVSFNTFNWPTNE